MHFVKTIITALLATSIVSSPSAANVDGNPGQPVTLQGGFLAGSY